MLGSGIGCSTEAAVAVYVVQWTALVRLGYTQAGVVGWKFVRYPGKQNTVVEEVITGSLHPIKVYSGNGKWVTTLEGNRNGDGMWKNCAASPSASPTTSDGREKQETRNILSYVKGIFYVLQGFQRMSKELH